jgi:phosphate transport system permease protein
MSENNGVLRNGAVRWRRSRNRRQIRSAAMQALAAAATALALIPLVWILAYVVAKGGRGLNLAFLTHLPRAMGTAGGGVLHAIEGSAVLILIAVVLAVPVGIIVAFYVADHGNTVLGTLVRFGTDVMSGIPSIVVGLFCYAAVIKIQHHYSALAGGISLAILMLPLVIRTTEEMIKLVPRSLSEASLALGGPRWKTALKVVLPSAGTGVATGVLLAIARAAGETAPILFTALGNDHYDIGQIVRQGVANGQGVFTIIGRIFGEPVDALPLTLWKYAQQPYPERVQQAWTVALVLMLLVLALNIGARLWISRRQAHQRG